MLRTRKRKQRRRLQGARRWLNYRHVQLPPLQARRDSYLPAVTEQHCVERSGVQLLLELVEGEP